MSDSDDEAPDKQLKIVIVGDGASGKVIFSILCEIVMLARSPVGSSYETCLCLWLIPPSPKAV